MTTPLLPCPFCGGAAMWSNDADGGMWIQCSQCLCSTIMRYAVMDDCKPLLAEAWNRRAPAWVSVTERLPAKYVEVLVAFAGISLPATGQYTGSSRDRGGWCYPAENRGMCDDGSDPTVTHWRELPAHPVPSTDGGAS